MWKVLTGRSPPLPSPTLLYLGLSPTNLLAPLLNSWRKPMLRPDYLLKVRVIGVYMPNSSERRVLPMIIWCPMREFSSQPKAWIAKIGVLSKIIWCPMIGVLPKIIWCLMRVVELLLSSKVCYTTLYLQSIMNFII